MNLRHAYIYTLESYKISNSKLNSLVHKVDSNFSKIKGSKWALINFGFWLEDEDSYIQDKYHTILLTESDVLVGNKIILK
jgi:hypothetical protein